MVENRPGASSQIGTDALVKSAPDGYTLSMSAHSFVVEQAGNKAWPFRFERDMTLISVMTGAGFVLTLSNNTPVANLRELIAYSKANPGKLNEGLPGGINPDWQILKHTLGMGELTTILYQGAQPAITAALAGDVNVVSIVPQIAAPLEKAGKLKVIAYTGMQRHPLMPHVPTVNEAGVGQRDHESGLWMILSAPGGLSSEIANKLYAATNEMLKQPDVAAKVAALGQQTMSLNPAQSRERMVALLKTYQDAIAAGVKMQ